MHMTTEEKLKHFSEVSMETAREEAQRAITEYKAVLEDEMEQHKKEKQAASENQFKIEAENAAREINKALSAEQLHIKRKLSRKQQELREILFSEIQEQLRAFTKSEGYADWLETKVKKALEIAGEDEIQISLSPEDVDLIPEIENRTGIKPFLAETSFLGGIRAVIPQKNILIDDTLLTSFQNEKESFNYDGGLRHE